MAITYSAQAGTLITTSLVGVNNLAQQVGAGTSEIYIAATAGTTAPSTANDYNANVGNGTNGIGDTYVGRIIVVRKGTATQEIRIITAATYATNVQTITVNELWDIQPAIGDAYDVCYEPGDIEDGGSGGGINLNSKSGLYELSNTLTINITGFFQIANGNALELDDDGANVSFIIESGGYYIAGLEATGAYISGGVMPSYNGALGEPSTQIQSGGYAFVHDTLNWAQLVGQQYECAAGSNGHFYRVKWLNLTDELHLYGALVRDSSASGKEAITDIVRFDSLSDVYGLVLTNVEQADSTANTTTETITLRDVLFTNVTNYITIRDNKTWNMLNPVWSVIDHTNFDETNVTATAAINDRSTVDAVVQEADGTKLQNALVNIYTHEQAIDGGAATLVSNLDLKLVTDIDGIAAGTFIYTAYNWAAGVGTNTVYSGHALQASKWLYSPFVATQISADKFDGTIVLATDPNIVQTTQATALTAGAGITWNDETNPSSIIEFTGGSGGTIGLAIGDTITGVTSTADGIVTDILDGDGVAGTIHLKTRDAIAFTAAEIIGNGADGWTATYTTATQQDFSIWIDGNALSYQTIYDYIAAKMTETTLSADGELFWEWCRDIQSQPLYSTGSSFYTEMSGGKGIIIVNNGAGSVDYFTDDSNVQWMPPVSYTLTLTNIPTSVKVTIVLSTGRTELHHAVSTGVDITYGHTGGEIVDILLNSLAYDPNLSDIYDLTLDNGDQSIKFQMIDELNYSNP